MSTDVKTMEVLAPLGDRHEEILTPEALAFVAGLVTEFGPRIDELLAARAARAPDFRRVTGWYFLSETRGVREGEWKVGPQPLALVDRRVEITGPVERKMIINGLNSGANVFMADFEDANSPTWNNVIAGQINLFDAVRRTITYEAPETGKRYQLNETTATLMVRPRGLHLRERHVRVGARDVPAALFDFGLFFFHNAKELLAGGAGPYFYLPKLEHHLEARLWNDVFVRAQAALELPLGTIKATVLIETLPAAFQMDEILFELREHSAGLNCGRWDYIFSYIKKRAGDPSSLLPDRAQITMGEGFLRAYSLLLIKTCHRRGAHAMGGMAAQIPIKDDPVANEQALARVRADKLREVNDGHDGTWVAHPALVGLAKEIFDGVMKGPNQLDRRLDDQRIECADLLNAQPGTRTDAGFRHNIRVGVQYLEAWLRGYGCVPLYNLMEDAATAEIARAQVWQWITLGTSTDDGRPVTADRFRTTMDEEMLRIRAELGDARFESGRFEEARALFTKLSLAREFEDFLTLPAYSMLRDS